jgi:hypothetical protein
MTRDMSEIQDFPAIQGLPALGVTENDEFAIIGIQGGPTGHVRVDPEILERLRRIEDRLMALQEQMTKT